MAARAHGSLRARASIIVGLVAGLLCAVPAVLGDTKYYQHSFFDNSAMPDAYFYSSGKASAPSTLELVHGHLPVNTKIFVTPPNALELNWLSAPNGGWDAAIQVVNFRNREIRFDGDTLYLWCYSQQGIAAGDLPLVRLEDVARNFSAPLHLGEFVEELPAGKWVQIKIPLSRFTTASIHPFSAQNLRLIVFSQGAEDGAKHSLVIDEIRIDSAEAAHDSDCGCKEDTRMAGQRRCARICRRRAIFRPRATNGILICIGRCLLPPPGTQISPALPDLLQAAEQAPGWSATLFIVRRMVRNFSRLGCKSGASPVIRILLGWAGRSTSTE